MSAYEELVDRCAESLWLDRYPDLPWDSAGRNATIKEDYRGHSRAILEEVLRTLETVTPEMMDAGDGVWEGVDSPDEPWWQWLAMLRASPLVPTKEGL